MRTPEINLMNCDCMDYMKTCKDNQFDIAIIDPPFRDNNSPTKDMRNNGFKGGYSYKKDFEFPKWKKPTKKYFNELFRISKNQIIWGANNFNLPPYKGFIVWKKKSIGEKFTMSMCELAYLSEGLGTISKFIEIQPQGNKNNIRIHPTQKPVKLYKWILKNYAKENDKIFDSHIGSGSIAIACYDMGFDLTGCEIDKDYYDTMMKRFEIHKAQFKINFPNEKRYF